MALDRQSVDARYATINDIRGDQYNYYTIGHESGTSSSHTPASLSFNEAPTGLLSPHFTGREEELDYIGKVLEVSHGNHPSRLAIFGMAGLGKSQLALKYAAMAYDLRRYSTIFWVSSTTIEKLNQGFANILNLIGHADRDHPDQGTRLMAARRWLEESDALGWLLILDNINKDTVGFLREHLPRKNSKGNILFTTRTVFVAEALTNPTEEPRQSLELQGPSLKDAVNLLLKGSGVSESQISSSVDRAEDVVKCLGCLPLAIAHAASFVKQSHKNMDELLELYKSDHKYEVFSWENDLLGYEEKSVAVTFFIQLEELERRSPDAGSLLKVLSFFDPESIPLQMLVEGAEEVSRPRSAPDTGASEATSPESHSPPSLVQKLKSKWRGKRSNVAGPTDGRPLVKPPEGSSKLDLLTTLICSPVQLHHAIQQLQNLSLVAYTSSSNATALRIHDLIHATIQESTRRENTQHQWFEIAVGLASGAFRRIDDPFSCRCWAQCELLNPHIQSLTTWDRKHATQNSDLLYANVGIADYLKSRGQYYEAGLQYQQALPGIEKLLGLDDPVTLSTIANLAIAYEYQGNYSEAEKLYLLVLERTKKRLGPKDPEPPGVLLDLSIIYRLQGHYDKAETMGAQALAGNEKQHGLEHPDTLQTVANLAVVHRSQGRYREAETLCKRALAGTEKMCGAEHTDTLDTMNNLAIVYQLQGRYGEAEKLHARALGVQEKILGPEHPSTLQTVSNIAIACHSQGRFSEAEALNKRALEGRQEQLGPDHPDTLDTVDNLALVYQSQGRFKEADGLHVQAVEGREKVLGPEHPNTLQAMDNLAVARHAQGRYGEAETLLKRSLECKERQLGADHLDTLDTVESMATVYESQGRYSEAEVLNERGLTGRKNLLGPEHPDTVRIIANLAVVYRSQGRYDEAEPLCRQVLTAHEGTLGHEHPETLTAVQNLAIVFQSQGRHQEAEGLYVRALAGREMVLGFEHPHTLSAVEKLAEFFKVHGRRDEEVFLRFRLASVANSS